MAQLKKFDRNINSISEILLAIEEDGGCIVKNFISADLTRRVREELAQDAMGITPGAPYADPDLTVFWGHNTKRFTRLLSRSPSFSEVLEHELMHAWASTSLTGDYWLNTAQAMIVGPGSKAQALHRDTLIWPILANLGPDAPEAMVSIMLALSDFKAETGATLVVPGSHKFADFNSTVSKSDAVQAVMPAGSALLYTGKTIHGAGANVTTDQWRFGLHMSFVLGWLTPEEASPIGVPWEIAKNFSPTVQRLLGYASPRDLGEGASPKNWMVDFEDVRAHLGVKHERPSKKSLQKNLNDADVKV